jgi:hypothetical protein
VISLNFKNHVIIKYIFRKFRLTNKPHALVSLNPQFDTLPEADVLSSLVTVGTLSHHYVAIKEAV